MAGVQIGRSLLGDVAVFAIDASALTLGGVGLLDDVLQAANAQRGLVES